jgi:hypothetical protein
VFVVRKRVAREDSDECLFQFSPVFVTAGGEIDNVALSVAVTRDADDTPTATVSPPDPSVVFSIAKHHLEQKLGLWDWDDDVEFIGSVGSNSSRRGSC